MSVTALGLLLVALSLRYAGSAPHLAGLVLAFGIFEGAAAFILGGFGLQPGLVPAFALMALMAAQYLAGRRSIAESQTLALMAPLLVLLAYGAVTAVLLPQTFAGRIIVWPQKLDGLAPQPIPLAPGQGNMNQVAYLTANIALVLAAALALGRAGIPWRSMVKAYLLAGYGVVGIAAWEFAHRTVGIPFPNTLLYSNPGWAIVQQSFGSLPRLQGPFAEPSAFGAYLAGLTMACAALCLRGHRVARADVLFVLGCVTTFLCTSTTGIAALCIGLPIQFAAAALAGRGKALGHLLSLLAVPATLAALCLAGLLIMRPELMSVLVEVIDSVLMKAETDSFTERASMNSAAWIAFLESGGLGIGWGSTRSSSVLPGLLAGAGLVGVVTVVWFGAGLVRLTRRARTLAPAGHPALLAMDAFGGALMGQLVAAVLTAPMITTPIFYMQLGIVAAAGIRILIDVAATRQVPARAAAPLPRGFQPPMNSSGVR